MKKNLKKIGKILSIFLVIIAVLMAGAFTAFEFYIKPKYLEKTIAELQSLLDNEEFQIDSSVIDGLQADIAETPLPEEVGATESLPSGNNELRPNVQDNTAGTAPPANTSSAETKENSTVDINKAMEEMEAEEKKRLFALIAKLDVPYLMKLAANGVTSEEKEEVKTHITGRLTDSEYSELKTLGLKYMYLFK